VRLLGNDRRSVWERAARASGVDVAQVSVRTEWPYLYFPGLRYLHVSALELDFPAGQVHTEGRVGPLVYRDRREPAAVEDVAAVRDFLAARTPDSPPLVLCVMGSILNPAGFYSRLVSAAEDADFEVLVLARDMKPDLPDNVTAVSYMPQIEALAHASVAIFHGGVATLNECVAAGVPMLVCSGRKLDENGNAARVAYHGVGLRASISASPRELRAGIETLLLDPSYRQHVEKLRERFAHYDKCDTALNQIEAWLAQDAR
jgi:UDP:flavonoid glycosyltransferase YjiC (YdhE family)